MHQRIDRALPHRGLSDAALGLIALRRPAVPDLWTVLGDLCRPGDQLDVWPPHQADQGFRDLLDLFGALDGADRASTEALLQGLRGDPASRLVPSVTTDGGRALLPIPNPGEGRLVMARINRGDGADLVPPALLKLAFLPDGLLTSEAAVDRAKPLGVRPFTVDTVLDRLNGLDDQHLADEEAESLLRFLWALLFRTRRSPFGTRVAAQNALAFAPKDWFWCQPGRAGNDVARAGQQRERYLASVRLPCRDGVWRPAGEIAFGKDWAKWLAAGHAGERIAAYRDLEAIAPPGSALLASPGVLLALLPDLTPPAPADGDEPEDPLDARQRDRERHAFLLRLGVWEVPPVNAFQDRTTANRAPFPEGWPLGAERQQQLDDAGGWCFGLTGWSGQRHQNVYLAEDFRFRWSLGTAATQDADALARCLRRGAALYRALGHATVFCTGCSDGQGWHSNRRQSIELDEYPSRLALDLRTEPWVMADYNGERLPRLQRPADLWWAAKPPSGSRIRQSPLRFLRLCDPATGIDEELRQLVGIRTLDEAGVKDIAGLLQDLGERFEQGLPEDPNQSGIARQAFVGLHRLIYERLVVMGKPAQVVDALAPVGLLCDLGGHLVYQRAPEARHDDGSHAPYVRHFAGKIFFVVLPRDRKDLATGLGVEAFQVTIERAGADAHEGQDVTNELSHLLGDRHAELLAILVHHSLGSQTLTPGSPAFEERSRRLRALRVRQVPDLVLTITAEGTAHPVEIGKGSEQDLFLDGATKPKPVLYHDLSGPDWRDGLRRKLAPHLAAILASPAYTHTFALFLQAEGDAEREEFLREIGISTTEVDAIARQVGATTDAELAGERRWFAAVIGMCGGDAADLLAATASLEPTDLTARLIAVGLDGETASQLVEFGGGPEVRRADRPDSALHLLHANKVDLAELHARLIDLEDPGLTIRFAHERFHAWLANQERRVVAVLSRHQSANLAKQAARDLKPPPALALDLGPRLPALLAPVVALLAAHGLTANAEKLDAEPAKELARVGAFGSVDDLDEQVRGLYDDNERARVLAKRASAWRLLIRLLAILARLGQGESRVAICAHNDAVVAKLPANPEKPTDLANAIRALFDEHEDLALALCHQCSDEITAPAPDRTTLLGVAQRYFPIDRAAEVEQAIKAPRRHQARALKKRTEQLADAGVTPCLPPGLAASPPTQPRPPHQGPRLVATIKVDPSRDRRKREIGDEAEQWALAAVLAPFVRRDADAAEREKAIDKVLAPLGRFSGDPVKRARGFAEQARARDIDEDDLIEALTGLLHVSRYSDAFGFDLIGWLPPFAGAEPRAMALEVKGSGDGSFILSRGEWSRAKQFNRGGDGTGYAVLVVRQGSAEGVPTCLDLLTDPYALLRDRRLTANVERYRFDYSNQPRTPSPAADAAPAAAPPGMPAERQQVT